MQTSEESKKMMRAVILTAYGSPDNLQLKEIEKPIPKDNEVLIKIYATTVTAGDCEIRALNLLFPLNFFMRLFIGFRKPKRRKVLGMELAGKVEAIGKNVTRFSPGDDVFASTGFFFGSYAEYICLPEESEEAVIEMKPNNISHEKAAAIPLGGIEALYHLRKAKIKQGQTLLIYGASGTIGTAAIQLAQLFGAEVSAVGNPKSLEMMQSLGAVDVFDYTKDDFTENDKKYDIIFDVVGKIKWSDCKKSLVKGGKLVLANPRLSYMFRGLFSPIKVSLGSASYTQEDFRYLKQLVEEDKLKIVIGRKYPLDQIPDAHRYVDEGYKIGNVVITLSHD